MINRFRLFLGPERIQALFLLLAFTGLGNLLLNVVADDVDWARPAQSVLVLVFLAGTVIIIGSRLDAYERGRWAGLALPAFGMVFIGVVFLPDLLTLTMGLALGWVLAGLFIFKPRGPMQYQKAVKLLRKSEFSDAVKEMDELIREEPEDPNHYRFRAEILRVWGKLDRARRDYEKMTQLAPDSAVAFNGLAEVTLQAGRYDEARTAALKAFELAPDEWVAAYNLGMIEDRLGEAEGAVEHLNLALQKRIGDVRHRLLIHFYLARAYARLGRMNEADAAVEAIRKHRSGLDEWQVILDSPQAATLRAVLAEDVAAAARLADDQMTPAELV